MRLRSRRQFLGLGAGLGVAATVARAAGGTPLTPTPGQTLGPCFAAGSPATVDFRPVFDASGILPLQIPPIEMILAGRLVNPLGCPIADARIEFWHTDMNGDYSDIGTEIASRPGGSICLFSRASFVQQVFRGHLFTDAEGTFRLDTYVPGLYGLRTRHIHFTVHDPRDDSEVLTSQLYFPAPFDVDVTFDGQPDLPNAVSLSDDLVLTGGGCPEPSPEECLEFYRDLILRVENQPATDGLFQTSCQIVVDLDVEPLLCPEPASALLTGAALVTLHCLAKRRRRIDALGTDTSSGPLPPRLA